MIRIIFFAIIFSFLTSFVSAQEAEIISIEGKVYVRDHSSLKWQKANVGQFLKAEAEVKTVGNGKCVIVFDQNRDSSVTIHSKTNIKIEEVWPGSVFLTNGRVFTLIKNLEKIGDFKIKTPTVVTGARGTGWITDFHDGVTSVSVFEDNVFIAGLDEKGTVVSEVNIQENFQTVISTGGEITEAERVSEIEIQQWQAEANVIEKLREEISEKQMEKPSKSTPDSGQNQSGPMGPHNMQSMLEKMKESGRYSEQEIQKMQDMMNLGFEQMTTEQMFQFMEKMKESGEMSAAEQGMMQEAMSRRGEIENMTPEQREDFFRQLEAQHGITHDQNSDNTNYFDQYMQSHNQGSFPDSENYYNYQGDQYFGEFDQSWNWQGAQYVQDPSSQYYYEQYNTINDQSDTCLCPSDCTITTLPCP